MLGVFQWESGQSDDKHVVSAWTGPTTVQREAPPGFTFMKCLIAHMPETLHPKDCLSGLYRPNKFSVSALPAAYSEHLKGLKL